MTPPGTKAALLELQHAAIARSPHVLDGELDEHEEAEGLKVRARELGLPINEDVAHVIRSGLQGHEAIPDKPATTNGVHLDAERLEFLDPATEAECIPPEPPPITDIDGISDVNQVAAETEAQRLKIVATPYTWIEVADIKRREWLYGQHYIRGFVSTTIGRQGLGKTSLVLGEIIDMVTGAGIFGRKGEPLRAWYIGEDPPDEIERRIATACAYHRISRDALDGRLFRDSILTMPHRRVAHMGQRGAVVDRAVVGALGDELIARQIDVLVVDPLAKFHAVPEIDNGAMDTVISAFADIAHRTRSAIETPHHTRKQPTGTSNSMTLDDARGASSITGAARSARVVNGMSQAEAERAGVAEGDRWRYFRIDDAKANMKPPGEARWMRHASEILPCGESVGVAALWQFPDAFAGFSADDLPRIRELARTGAYRSDSRSPEWFGNPVADLLRLDIEDKRDRGRVSAMIKTWMKNKVLDIEMRPDASRRDREFIVPGPYTTTLQAAE